MLDELVRARSSTSARAFKPDDPAVVLFTSGSEGKPKGVVLSNANLVANAYQVKAHAGDVLSIDDVFFNPLPIFHSFGLTAGLLTSLLNGIKVVLYPSPLHYRQIPKLIEGTKSTILLATDTFLQGYARAADEDDLTIRPLRHRRGGARQGRDTPQALAAPWHGDPRRLRRNRMRACRRLQLAGPQRPGSVGPFLPGIEWRLEPVEGIHEGGRLSVRGPNVMRGYLDAGGARGASPRPMTAGTTWATSSRSRTAWCAFSAGRSALRRSAGEMISLAAIETVAQALWPEFNHVVVALPDPRKGEQVVLITDKPNADRDALLAYAREQGFPELWVPKAILVSSIPVLGSGKTDYAASVEMARRLQAML